MDDLFLLHLNKSLKQLFHDFFLCLDGNVLLDVMFEGQRKILHFEVNIFLSLEQATQRDNVFVVKGTHDVNFVLKGQFILVNAESFLLERFQCHHAIEIRDDFVDFCKTALPYLFARDNHFLETCGLSILAELLEKVIEILFSVNNQVYCALFALVLKLERELVFFVF